MADEEKRKGGGKLSRSETVTVRLDPKLRYLSELAARKQRRTLSSYIEWALEESLKSVNLYEGTGYGSGENTSVADAAVTLWDVDEAERFVRLAIHYRELLTHQEQEIWKMLSDSNLLAPAQQRRPSGLSWNSAVLEDLVFPEIRLRWQGLMTAYAGSAAERLAWVGRTREEMAEGTVYPKSPVLPSPPKPATGFDDMDDDIPF